MFFADSLGVVLVEVHSGPESATAMRPKDVGRRVVVN
jgi:hypothetical protein